MISILIYLLCVLLVLFICLYFIKQSEYGSQYYNNAPRLYLENFINHTNGDQDTSINIFYINLDKSIDRKDKMESQLKLYFPQFTRISAINGGELDPLYKNKLVNNISYDLSEFERTITRGKPSSVIGCLLSHIKAILKIHNMSLQYALIMEDDMDLKYVSQWNTNISRIINNAPSDWEIIKLFTNNTEKIKQDIKLFEQGIKYRELDQNDLINEWSTGCYIINKKGINKIIEDVKNNNKVFSINKNKYSSLVADYYLYKNKKVYEYTQPLVAPFPNNESEIEKGGINSADVQSEKIIREFYG